MGKFLKQVLLFCYNRVNVLSISYKNYSGDEKHLIYVFKKVYVNKNYNSLL